ncbi:hypothetical protein [Amycolatopsis sp. WGS_07]|uniref:hypothetical protein n=1 Tax=Amycolatopsis sp. WGS_07 TaxID=3076764 RepID=UPI003873C506
MRPKQIALLASAAGGTALSSALPTWCVVTVALAGVALAAAQVAVTQIIRLRLSGKIATSAHAVRVLELQDGARDK